MKKHDLALTCPNPRIISAIYFGLLSVVGTILIDAFLTTLGVKERVPLFFAIILGMIVSSIAGGLMGDRLIHSITPYKLKAFMIGFLMVILSLPFFALGLFLMMKQGETTTISTTPTSQLYYYFYVLLHSYLYFGILLAIGSGFAAMYLRGSLVYDILSTYQSKNKITKLPDSPMEKNKIEHSDRVKVSNKK